MNPLIIVLILVLAFFAFMQFSGKGLAGFFKGGSELMADFYGLNPDEKIVEQFPCQVDPNAHVSKGKMVALTAVGVHLKKGRSYQMVITDRDRLIMASGNDHRVTFDKNNVPKITDTNVVGRANIPGAGEKGHILQIDSPLIDELMILGDAEVFEISVPVDSIPLVFEWLKKVKK